MFQVTSESIQRWTRVVMYTGFGALAQHGWTVSTSMKELVISGVGLVATAAWTMYGSRVNAMLTELGKVDGIEKVIPVVDPEKINPSAIAQGTPNNVIVKTER